MRSRDYGTPEAQFKRELMLSKGADPTLFRVERFQRDGLLSIEQASAGVRMYMWFVMSNTQGVRAVDCSKEVFSDRAFQDDSAMDRKMAHDYYIKTMILVSNASRADAIPYDKIIRWTAIEELTLSNVRRNLKKGWGSARRFVSYAFDELIKAQNEIKNNS